MNNDKYNNNSSTNEKRTPSAQEAVSYLKSIYTGLENEADRMAYLNAVTGWVITEKDRLNFSHIHKRD